MSNVWKILFQLLPSNPGYKFTSALWHVACGNSTAKILNMKIAQVAPLYEAVPPKLYGGTERIVSFLTEELVKQGHDVTLFSSGDSITNAKLVACVPEALRLKEKCEDSLAPHIAQLQKVIERSGEFDIIHFHTDYLSFPFTQFLDVPHLTTLHGKLTIEELQMIYDTYPYEPVVCISDSQCKPLPQANFVGRVHHGLPVDLFKQGNGGGNYFAFLGRISPEKRCDRAIEIAIATNTPIKIAAKIDKADREYFEREIKSLLDHPLVNFVGEINEKQKQEFLGNALALLFPIDWPEPFGLVTIEAMACGTPVLGWNCGSVPEIIEDTRSGFIVDSMPRAIEAAKKISSLNRSKVRQCFEQRFTVKRMTEQYLDLYQKLIVQNSFPSIVNGKAIPISNSITSVKAI
jgi:glycosyltransferase involved in cell wall biosynthesis